MAVQSASPRTCSSLLRTKECLNDRFPLKMAEWKLRPAEAYPVFDDICEILCAPCGLWCIPEEGTIVYRGIAEAVASRLGSRERGKLDELSQSLEGSWFIDVAGFYHAITRQNALAFFTGCHRFGITSTELFTRDPYVPSQNNTFTFTARHVSFLTLIGSATAQLLRGKKFVDCLSVLELICGRQFRLIGGDHVTVSRELHLPRIHRLLQFHPVFVRSRGEIVGLATTDSYSFPSRGILEQCLHVLKTTDLECLGMSAEEIRWHLAQRGVTADVSEISKALTGNMAVFHYFGLFGIRPMVAFEKLDRKPLIPLNRSFEELVVATLYSVERPVTHNVLFQRIEGMDFEADNGTRVTVTAELRNNVKALLTEAPFVLNHENRFYMIHPNAEGDFLGGLYANLYQIHREKVFTWGRARIWNGIGECMFARRAKQIVSGILHAEQEIEPARNAEQRRDLSADDCRTIAMSRHRWNTLLARKETVEIYTKQEYEKEMADFGITRSKNDQVKLDHVLVNAWKRLKKRLPENHRFSTAQFLEELTGRQFSKISRSSVETFTLSDDEKSKNAVQDALARSMCFWFCKGEWKLLDKRYEWGNAGECYHSFLQVRVSSVKELKAEYPHWDWFPVEMVKQRCMKKGFLTRHFDIPSMVPAREKLIGSDNQKLFSHMPFLLFGNHCTLFSYVAPRDYSNCIVPLTPWVLRQKEIEELNQIPVPDLSKSEIDAVYKFYRQTFYSLSSKPRVETPETRGDASRTEESQEKEAGPVLNPIWNLPRRMSGPCEEVSVVSTIELDPEVLAYPDPVKIPGE